MVDENVFSAIAKLNPGHQVAMKLIFKYLICVGIAFIGLTIKSTQPSYVMCTIHLYYLINIKSLGTTSPRNCSDVSR